MTLRALVNGIPTLAEDFFGIVNDREDLKSFFEITCEECASKMHTCYPPTSKQISRFDHSLSMKDAKKSDPSSADCSLRTENLHLELFQRTQKEKDRNVFILVNNFLTPESISNTWRCLFSLVGDRPFNGGRPELSFLQVADLIPQLTYSIFSVAEMTEWKAALYLASQKRFFEKGGEESCWKIKTYSKEKYLVKQGFIPPGSSNLVAPPSKRDP